MKKINTKDYPIFIGSGSCKQFNFKQYTQVAVLVDENTAEHALPYFINTIDQTPIFIQIDSGEKHKNIDTCQKIWTELNNHNFDRDSLLINLGGGMIGDIGGFAASTYKRGIDFVQIPTTLLAMADASIGGKTGVNFKNFKNEIGLFQNPKAVLIEAVFLKTLPENELLSGFAEIVKHALISDRDYWIEIQQTSFENMNWEKIIYRSIEIKNNIVNNDPLEKCDRKKLNFGHTIGHAVESYFLSQGKTILHGEAIALGMLEEIKMSQLSIAEKNEIKSFINKTFSYPNLPPKKELKKWIQNDKKNKNGNLYFALLKGIGNCEPEQVFDANELFS